MPRMAAIALLNWCATKETFSRDPIRYSESSEAENEGSAPTLSTVNSLYRNGSRQEGTFCGGISVLHPTWALQCRSVQGQGQLYNEVRDKYLPNGCNTLKAIFNLLARRSEPSIDGLSIKQTGIYMVQVVFFLELMISDLYPASELLFMIAQISKTILGLDSLVF